MSKYTDTSLNMPKGSYHIRLSNGCWYITQILCSHPDTLTSLNKSLVCLNELGVHGFLCLNLQVWISILQTLFSFPILSCLYGVWAWVCMCHPLNGIYHLIAGLFNKDRHIVVRCPPALFYFSPNTADFYTFPITNKKNPLFLAPRQKQIVIHVLLPKKQNKNKAALLVTLETAVLFEMAVLYLQNFRLVSLPRLPCIILLKLS